MEERNDSLVELKKKVSEIESILSIFNEGENLQILALQEIAYLEAASLTKPFIKECDARSVLLAVKTVLKQNLTLDPHAGLVFIKSRNVNTGTLSDPKWTKVLEIEPTVNGRISFARQCGRILDIKRPVVEYNPTTGHANKVTVSIQVPGYPHPRWEEYVFTEDEDIYRWRRASHKENRRAYDNLKDEKKEGKKKPDDSSLNYANENYTNFKGGPDPEFLRAKAIKHALKKLGTNQNEKVTKPSLKVEKIPVVSQEAALKLATEETSYEEINPNAL